MASSPTARTGRAQVDNHKIRQFPGEDWGVAGGRGWSVEGVWSVYVLSNVSGRGVVFSVMIVGGVWPVYVLSNDSGRGVVSSYDSRRVWYPRS